jgi:hypothetical protein
METLTPSYKERECEHCPNNPAALRPFDKMKNVKFDTRCLERLSKKLGVKMDCLACRQLREVLRGISE